MVHVCYAKGFMCYKHQKTKYTTGYNSHIHRWFWKLDYSDYANICHTVAEFHELNPNMFQNIVALTPSIGEICSALGGVLCALLL